jgi:hypothetical protein
VVHLFDQPLPRPRAPFGNEAASVLACLRSGLGSPNPQVAFFSHLIAETNRRLGGPDLAAQTTTADAVLLDGPTMEIFYGRAFRSTIAYGLEQGHLAPAGVPGGPGPVQSAPLASGARSLAATPLPPDCSSDGLDGWVMWLFSKLTGGIALGGGEFNGIFVEIFNKAAKSGEVTPGLAGAFGFTAKYGGWLSTIITALTAIYAITSLQGHVVLETGEPLIRNKRRSEGDGKAGRLLITVALKTPNNEEETQIRNCIAMLLSAVGNNTLLPNGGPLVGVQVDIIGSQGFAQGLVTAGSSVLFGPERVQLRQYTDDKGQVRIGVQGRQQRQDFPDTAAPVKKQASIEVKAAPQPITGSTLGRTFLDSLLCGGSLSVTGCADAIADIAQSFTWNLGEFPFEVRDWQAPRYAFVGIFPAPAPERSSVYVGAVSCTEDLTGQWVVASSSNSDIPVTKENLISQIKDDTAWMGTGLPGEKVSIAHVPALYGMLTLLESVDDSLPKIRLTVVDLDDTHVFTGEFQLFPVEEEGVLPICERQG